VSARLLWSDRSVQQSHHLPIAAALLQHCLTAGWLTDALTVALCLHTAPRCVWLRSLTLLAHRLRHTSIQLPPSSAFLSPPERALSQPTGAVYPLGDSPFASAVDMTEFWKSVRQREAQEINETRLADASQRCGASCSTYSNLLALSLIVAPSVRLCVERATFLRGVQMLDGWKDEGEWRAE
jgi:hypothetical protein